MSGYLSPRFDWQRGGAIASRHYVIASTYRCGSSYLSARLWRTGLLGAPWEYFNYESEMELMQTRLGTSDPDEYIDRLISRRTSANGVFGFKAHFHHFEAALKHSASLREMMGDANFIYLDRRDKLAQAVSMAKALQSRAWISLGTARHAPLFYSFEFIKACLEELKNSSESWWRWFEAAGKTPRIVIYEDLMLNADAVVDGIIEYIDVDRSHVSNVNIPEPSKQSDDVNREWIERFTQEWRLATKVTA
jgi:LPS sulfotransferase NodH